MQQDQFDRWLRDAAREYNTPPKTDVDSLWVAIEQQRDRERLAVFDTAPVVATIAPARPWWSQTWIRAAAVLALGVGLGRMSVTTPTSPAPQVAVISTDSVNTSAALVQSTLDAPDAERYLGQTVALLASLQTDPRPARGDTVLASRAGRLLSTTRFLLDSPSATDPSVRALLEDLELVLVQIVQMPSSRSATDVELIHQAMKQRDVMPRLRTAVASLNSAD